MDPSLLKQREAFKARALSNPVVEKRAKKSEPDAATSKSRPAKKAKLDHPKPARVMDYKTMSGSSQNNFAILAKIVKHLRTKHQQGDMEPLTIDELLDETNQLDITIRQKHWLSTEALTNNPKVEVVEGDKYKFKPVLNVNDRKGLIRLLDKHDMHGYGGILLDEVEESVPNAAKALKILGDQVIQITRPIDKKKVLFYNNKGLNLTISEDIQKLWRSVPVEGVDERKIEEYLQRHNIVTMQDRVIKKATQKRSRAKKKSRQFKTHNEHLTNVLKDYSDKNDK